MIKNGVCWLFSPKRHMLKCWHWEVLWMLLGHGGWSQGTVTYVIFLTPDVITCSHIPTIPYTMGPTRLGLEHQQECRNSKNPQSLLSTPHLIFHYCDKIRHKWFSTPPSPMLCLSEALQHRGLRWTEAKPCWTCVRYRTKESQNQTGNKL